MSKWAEIGRVSHLQFADDTIFFSRASFEELHSLKLILLVFGRTLSGINIRQEQTARGNPNLLSFWDPALNKVSRRLDGWKKPFYHLVSWDMVYKPKESSGLGFWKISQEPSFIRKWLWRKISRLWHHVILSTYGTHPNGWEANNIIRWPHRCPWKPIGHILQVFSTHIRFVNFSGGMEWVQPSNICDMLVISFKCFRYSIRGKTLWRIACLSCCGLKAWMEEGTTSWRCVAEGSYSALFFCGREVQFGFLEGICPQRFEWMAHASFKGVSYARMLLDLYTLISWARFNMCLKRKLHLALMGGSLIMSEFQKVVVAERVLQLGMRNFRRRVYTWRNGLHKSWLYAFN
ncbi:hypothetical protein AAG906_009957 [Vitis piasezkii]